MTLSKGEGIVDAANNHSVDETVEKLKGILNAKGVTLFALIDHSSEAEKAGMKMRPTKLLIFGSPKAGSPVMLAAPSIAIDLPLKVLVWEDISGKAWVSYNSPHYLRRGMMFRTSCSKYRGRGNTGSKGGRVAKANYRTAEEPFLYELRWLGSAHLLSEVSTDECAFVAASDSQFVPTPNALRDVREAWRLDLTCIRNCILPICPQLTHECADLGSET